MRAFRSVVHREDGMAILEFALAMPFLTGFLFFIIDLALFGYSYISATNAVREGARCGAVGGTNAAISTRIQNTSGGLGNFGNTPSITRSGGIGGNISVSADYTYDWITPVGLVPGLSSLTFTKTAQMRLETDQFTKASC